MAKFFGTVQGGRGRASRLGHAASGLQVTAQSHEGSIIVTLYVDDDETFCTIGTASGSQGSRDFILFSGPINKLFDDQFISRFVD